VEEELLIDILNTEQDVASGMHEPAGEAMWSVPNNAAMADDKLPGGLADNKSPSDFNKSMLEEGIKIELEHTSDKLLAREIAMDHLTEDKEYYNRLKAMEKEAMGLLDVPFSIGSGESDEGDDESGEVLTFKGTQNPGLSRGLGDGEETDYFGAAEDGVDLPPRNHKYQDDNKFIEFLFSNKESYNRFMNLTKKALRTNGEAMISELSKLEDFFRKAGKSAEANSVSSLKKTSGATGAAAGAAAGLPIGLLAANPVLGTIFGAGAGSMIENFLYRKPEKKSELERQKALVNSLEEELRGMKVDANYLAALTKGTIKPNQLAGKMVRAGVTLSTADSSKIPDVAAKYVVEANKLSALFKEIEEASQVSTQPLEQGEPIKDRKPVAAPRRTETPPGPITRPGDPYTYGPNPGGEGYIVVSGPGGKGEGNVILPGTPGYEEVKAADLTAQDDNAPAKEVGPPNAQNATTEDHSKARGLQPGEVQVRRLTPEKKRRVMRALRLDGGANSEDSYQRWLSSPKTLYKGPVPSEKGQVAVVDFGDKFPADIRYDGIRTNDGKTWFGSPLNRRERRDLELKGREQKGVRQELRRENRPSNLRDNPRSERREQRQRDRVSRREDRRQDRRTKARKASRLAQIEGLHKLSRSGQ